MRVFYRETGCEAINIEIQVFIFSVTAYLLNILIQNHSSSKSF